MGTFTRLGMTRTRLMWRPDFASILPMDGTIRASSQPHDERSKVRVAGSMDTTITDLVEDSWRRLVRGDGLSKALTRGDDQSSNCISPRRTSSELRPGASGERAARRDLCCRTSASSSSMGHRDMASSKVDTTSRLRTRSCALRRASGASCSSLERCACRGGLRRSRKVHSRRYRSSLRLGVRRPRRKVLSFPLHSGSKIAYSRQAKSHKKVRVLVTPICEAMLMEMQHPKNSLRQKA